MKQIQRGLGKSVGTGIFGVHAKVDLPNEGLVTNIIDTKNKV